MNFNTLNTHRSCVKDRVAWALTLCLLTSACQNETKEDVNSSMASPVDKEPSAKIYTPPPGYAPSKSDPLLALYGGSKSKGAKITDSKLSRRFESEKEIKLSSAFPRAWRRAISDLSKVFSVKVTQWRSTTGTRMERAKKNRSLSLTFKTLGKRTELQRNIYAHLSKIDALKTIPKRLGDHHEHLEEKGAEKLSFTYSLVKSTSHQDDPLSIATVEIEWSRERPQPNPLTKNCRYVHGLRPDLGAQTVEWAAQHFKSTSTRRFVEWTEELSPENRTWRATWIYRNGSYRDKAVGWWTDRISKRGATQRSMTGMEQVWSTSDQGTIEWWPETDPSPMGCEIAGPLLTVSSTQPSP